MNLRKLILFIICTFLSFSLFAKKAEPAPKWLSDLNSVYPDSEYIAKIGSGKKLDDARTNAVGNIATFIKTDVTKNTQASQIYQNINNKTLEKRVLDVQTNILSDVSLYGLEFTEGYYVKKEKRWYCVAYIEREFAWNYLKPPVEQQYEIFNSYIQKAEQEPYSINKINYLQTAKIKSEDFLQELLSVLTIYPKATQIYHEALETIYNLPSQIQKLKNDLTVSLELQTENEYKNSLKNYFSQNFDAMGLRPSGNANYILSVELTFDILENEVFVVYPSVQIDFLSNDKVSLYSYNYTVSDKTAAYTLDIAKKKSLQKLYDNLSVSFADDFKKFFNLED